MSVILWVSYFLVSAVVSNPVAKVTEAKASQYRLPKTVEPLEYTLIMNLTNDFHVSDSFAGTLQITINVKEKVSEIKLHSKDLTITEVKLQRELVNIPLKPGPYESDEETSILTITPLEDLQPGTYKLHFSYDGELESTDMHGFYKSSYVNEQGEVEYLATTQLESTHARRVFPCFDEPSFKAIFDVEISYPIGYNAIYNTPRIAIPTVQGNLESVHFERSPKMSTYLNAFIISKFTCTKGDNLQGNIPYSVCSRTEAEATRSFAVQIGPLVMKALDDFMGILYSSKIKKMDQIAIPDFSAGAMENWGLVTYRETNLLWDEAESSNSYMQSLVSVVAHEFAHMWFGNLVTLDWWSDVFLNEGFARYFQYFATDKVKPEWEMLNQFVPEQVHTALLLDSTDSAKALSSDVNTPEEISARFDSISYNKGACILRMLTHVMGLEHFQQGLQDYLKTHSESNTLPADLWSALSPHVTLPNDHKFDVIMENWTVHPGYPVLNVRLEKNNTVVVTQKRFLLVDSADTDSTKWYVPITFTTSSQTTGKFSNTSAQTWLVPNQELTIKNDLGNNEWIILNNQQTGYYRVNYDDTLWERISSALEEDLNNIHVLNRANIVDDLFNFARSSQTTYNKALEITSFLNKDTEYYPWIAAFKGFSFMLQKLGNLKTRKSMNDHILKSMDAIYKSVPFYTEKVDDQIYTLKQGLALRWACKLGNEDCVKNSLDVFTKYKADDTKRPSKNQRSVVYCTALRNSKDVRADWNFLWNKFTNEKLSTEKVTILSALGCVKDEAILTDYLTKAVTATSGIRLQDSATAISSVYNGNPEGVSITLNFLDDNYQKIAAYYNSDVNVAKLIKNLASLFTDKSQVDKLKKLIDSGKLSNAVKVTANEVLKESEADLEWIKGFEKELTGYFTSSSCKATTSIGLIVTISLLYQLLY